MPCGGVSYSDTLLDTLAVSLYTVGHITHVRVLEPCLHGLNGYQRVEFAVQPRLSRGRAVARPRIYAGGGRGELIDGRVNPAIFAAQKKGIFFDIGHGGGSFAWQTAVQAFKERYYPDSLSTDLHVASMNAGMKDMTNVMSKFLALGMPLEDVIVRSTWNPAKEIKLEQLGNLSVGARRPTWQCCASRRASSASSTSAADAWMARRSSGVN